MYTLYKVRVKLMYTLYNNLTIFSKKWLKSGLLQFLTMWILWDRKCEYGFFHITHAKNSSNHSSSTRDLTRFFGICDVEKAILTFPPHSILSLLINVFVLLICSVDAQRVLETIPYVPHLFMAPISVIISMWLLYNYLDLAALGGIAVLLLLFPINIWGSRKSEKLQGIVVCLFSKGSKYVCIS